MDLLLNLPDDMFRQHLLQYLSIDDIVLFDNACTNHQYRSFILDKIANVIITGSKNRQMNLSLFKWIGIRKVYLINICFGREWEESVSADLLQLEYNNQLKHSKHVDGIDVSDLTIIPLSSYCSELKSFSLLDCEGISDESIISIAMHCPGLHSLDINWFETNVITDIGLIAISGTLRDVSLRLSYHICSSHLSTHTMTTRRI